MSTNLFDLNGKVALITGGATGIGKGIAKTLVDHGARVLIGSRRKDVVDQAVIDLTPKSDHDDPDPPVAGINLDVTHDKSVERACRRAVDQFGQLDILVNSAGILGRGPVFELSPDEFNRVHETHVTGSLRCCIAVGHIFREQHGGCIINIASLTSMTDVVHVAAYAAAKCAVVGLTRSLANEWAKFGIRTNAIAPGFVPTDLNRTLIENTDRGRRILEHTPMGRFGTPEEIAGAAVYLASPAASFVNGHTLVVDGGFLAVGVTDSVAPWGGAGSG